MTFENINDVELNPHVSADCVIFGYDADELKVLLIERSYFHQDKPTSTKKVTDWLLPGDLVRDDEDLDQSARRVLKELTDLENIYLEQFYAFGNPDRVRKAQDAEWLKSIRAHPEARVITIGYLALVKLEGYVPSPHSFARKSVWFSVKKVPDLAFDHNQVLAKALETLRFKLKYSSIAFELMPKKFTIGQLQKLYEVIADKKFDKRNFRRKLKSLNLLLPLDEKQKGVSHKPASVYKYNHKAFQLSQKEIF
jgi:8-oxo-dGTP diphosphatase